MAYSSEGPEAVDEGSVGAKTSDCLRTVLDGLDVAVYVADMDDHRVLFANRRIRNLLGDVTGAICWQALQEGLDGPCAFCTNDQLVDEVGRPTGPVVKEINNPKAGGWWEVHDQAIRWDDGRLVRLEIAISIEGRKRAEEASMQASRMEATATLAGGLAHDFNNLMVGVLGNAELLRDTIGGGSEAEMLDDICVSARRAAELAQLLLAFARSGKNAPVLLDVNALVREALRSRAEDLTDRILIDCDLQVDPWTVEADPTQIMHLLISLCANSEEAIEGQGWIVVRTRNVEFDEVSAPSGLEAGRYVHLAVEDTGAGMDEQIRARVFEPFFSTKSLGRGLGLAAAFGIVENHGGQISARSIPGEGAIFDVYLPASGDDPG